jgi:hypothetical protein
MGKPDLAVNPGIVGLPQSAHARERSDKPGDRRDSRSPAGFSAC